MKFAYSTLLTLALSAVVGTLAVPVPQGSATLSSSAALPTATNATTTSGTNGTQGRPCGGDMMNGTAGSANGNATTGLNSTDASGFASTNGTGHHHHFCPPNNATTTSGSTNGTQCPPCGGDFPGMNGTAGSVNGNATPGLNSTDASNFAPTNGTGHHHHFCPPVGAGNGTASTNGTSPGGPMAGGSVPTDTATSFPTDTADTATTSAVPTDTDATSVPTDTTVTSDIAATSVPTDSTASSSK